MFQLDDGFLQSLGLGNLPDEQKGPFLQHLREELETRVGEKLAEGLSDAQLLEFEGIIERQSDKVEGWLAKHWPDFQSDASYQAKITAFSDQKKAALTSAEVAAINAEYAATKWLDMYRPNYKNVVTQTLEELRTEIMNNRDQF